MERVAAAARAGGHEVRLLDLQIFSRDDFAAELREFRPEAVGFGLNYLANVPEVIELAQLAKQVLPGCFTFAGGHSLSFIAGHVLEQADGGIDAVVRGEGEVITPRLLDAARDGGLVRKQYYLETRADVLLRNTDVFARWRRLGLNYMFLGIEALDEGGLDAYRKRVSTDENLRALEAAWRLGLTVAINLIVDPAWDTRQFQVIREFAMSVPEIVHLSVMTPYPGTEIWHTQSRQLTTRDYRLFDIQRYKAVAGSYVLWFLILLAAGKMLATSLTIGIGGSGGVFAPSLFTGATSGMAFGEIARHLLGPAAGNPALYAAVGMGAVFTAAARAPLTSLASVVEMTGDFALTLPVMLAVAIATATSRAISYGTIYTTKLLRRGTAGGCGNPRHVPPKVLAGWRG